MVDVPMEGARHVPLDEPLHMPGWDGRNLCDGRPYVTRLLEVDFEGMRPTTYGMCQKCWTLVMAGAQVGPDPNLDPYTGQPHATPVDVAAHPPKEIEDDRADDERTVTFTRVNDLSDPPVVRATAERLDQVPVPTDAHIVYTPEPHVGGGLWGWYWRAPDGTEYGSPVGRSRLGDDPDTAKWEGRVRDAFASWYRKRAGDLAGGDPAHHLPDREPAP